MEDQSLSAGPFPCTEIRIKEITVTIAFLIKAILK